MRHFVPKYILKRYLKQFSTKRLDIVQNVLIPSISSSPKISQGGGGGDVLPLDTLVSYTTSEYWDFWGEFGIIISAAQSNWKFL